MTPDCLSGEFKSRTANHDIIISLPQLDTRRPHPTLRSPRWTYGPIDEDEDQDQDAWGLVLPDLGTLKVRALLSLAGLPVDDDELDEVQFRVLRCRFYTSLTASTDEEFEAAADKFVMELEDWWARFTSWVSILTSQDFVQIGGGNSGISAAFFYKSWNVEAWTTDADGQRMSEESYGYATENRVQPTPLELQNLQACIAATGDGGAPPTEWMLIRDARSLLNTGQTRRAVIDAATAAELAMTKLIDNYLATANTTDIVKKALDARYRALEGRARLLRDLRKGLLSHRLDEDLIKPRNYATHRGHALTDEQAQTAVDMATAVVEEAYPLASLLHTNTA
ncbi:Uncharacterised protein [Mycolicibacterium aichiense]|nr:Uncharacterised protein [Mycolicibacterium aichiense]